VPLGAEAKVTAHLRNGDPRERTVQLTLAVDDVPQSQRLTVPPEADGEAAFPVMLPASLDKGRSWTRRLWLAARDETGAAFDLKWLTVAPIMPCPTVRQAPRLTEDGKDSGVVETRLGEANLLSDPKDWNGLYDLGASFGLARDGKNLYVLVRVLDDQVLVRDPGNDGVELFFDLRPPADRGRPVYDHRCFALAVRPSSYGQWTRISALSDDPTGFATITGTARRHFRGYSLLLTVPFDTLESIAGGPVASFGFDFMVHDADTSGTRKTTMVWSGRRDNLINPSGFGEVRLADKVETGTARVGVF
jgi:hypothetical protein